MSAFVAFAPQQLEQKVLQIEVKFKLPVTQRFEYMILSRLEM